MNVVFGLTTNEIWSIKHECKSFHGIMTIACTDVNTVKVNGSLCDISIFTLEQIIVLNKYCTYKKPISKISHVKTLQNLCKMRYKKKKVRKKMLKVIILFFKRRL